MVCIRIVALGLGIILLLSAANIRNVVKIIDPKTGWVATVTIGGAVVLAGVAGYGC